jgi:hypothetical protein
LGLFSPKTAGEFRLPEICYGKFGPYYSFSENFLPAMHPALAASPNSTQSNALTK